MTKMTLNLKGLNCPLPVIRSIRAVKLLLAGDILEVLVTDPAAPMDFEAFCEVTGNELVECREKDGIFTIVICKSG